LEAGLTRRAFTGFNYMISLTGPASKSLPALRLNYAAVKTAFFVARTAACAHDLADFRGRPRKMDRNAGGGGGEIN